VSNPIPFLDLISLHSDLEEELVAAFRSALKTCQFIGGPEVEGFEREFADYCGSKHCIGVGSGTDALRFALIAGGIQPGDRVLTAPHTFIATTEAISQAGAYPEFIDIDATTYNIDPDKLADFLQRECRQDPQSGQTIHNRSAQPVTAIVPVHLYGQPADMDRIIVLADDYGLAVIEDACQAQGAAYYSARRGKWLKAGALGQSAAFSFYPGKNLGACGEAGAVTTDDDDIASRIRMLRDHGQRKKYYHDIEGYNGRLDAIQAAFLRIKLRRLTMWNDDRRRIAKRYDELLTGVAGVTVPTEPDWSRSVYHLYVIRVKNREALQTHLLESGIATGLHYPVPLHQQQAYADRNRESYPVCEQVAQEIVSLPMFPGMTEEQLQLVAAGIQAFLIQHNAG
jgi:dTDP-4-amino-4,6-dideoxygalactose transaminase